MTGNRENFRRQLMNEISSWGKTLPQGAKRSGELGGCPYCGHNYGDMIVSYWGIPDTQLLKQVIGFSTNYPVSKAHSVGVVVIECPKCFEKSWFHVEKEWALAVREFSPHSPSYGNIQKELSGDELEEALFEMNVFRVE